MRATEKTTEKTYYNVKWLHVWMAVASLALVAVTVWMLLDDHRRQWKQHQRTFRDRVEPWLTEARIEELHAKVDRPAADIKRPDAEAGAALAEHRSALERLDRTLMRQRPSLAKRILSLPLLDAFGRPLSIDQVWLPELTIDYNFRKVARFDRCTTCHQGIDKGRPGQPGTAALRRQKILKLQLPTPAESPRPQGNREGTPGEPTLERIWGLVLAERGILDPQAATVLRVVPMTPAADARLQVGDVILKIGDQPITRPADVGKVLLGSEARGRPISLEVRRGLPQPYCSHPRLDLFVGSLSPHPKSRFGCTICHAGQGSATQFAWASHTPNDPAQRRRWREEHDWFRNPHWDFPMAAERFVESRCLRCHHAVTDLEPGGRFPDPPAPKLLAGYDLVRRSGCFGCHEIKGYDAAGRPIGPDMRLEPNYSAAALQLLATAELTGEQRQLARQVADRPEDAALRTRLVDSFIGRRGDLSPGSLAMVALLSAEEPHPGTMRKVGPSLRHVGARLEAEFMRRWIRRPRDFRPATRMPRFYGLHGHLDGRSRSEAERLEPAEIRGIVAYLLAAGRPIEPPPSPPGATQTPSIERGRRLFEIHGCLACHKHTDFPKGQSVQAPDLSRLAQKYGTEKGCQWLAGWIRDPLYYSPQTLMPNPLLEPEPLGDGDGMTDPAAEIAAYLLTPEQDRQPPERSAVEKRDIDKRLADLGFRTIRRRGCFGCHDIPGFEDAQPIGPALSDWGRKQESLLGFEQIHEYLEQSSNESKDRLVAAGTAHKTDPDGEFFRQALREHRREGFVWQKLHQPRSFDYKRAQDKPYDQWLKMGRFGFTDEQVEALSTFVLGLVADPPAEQYVYHPQRRAKAIIEGRKVLQKYACAECHTLEMDRWTFEFDPEEFEQPPPIPDFPFMKPNVSQRQVAASLETDNRGLARAELVGKPRVDDRGRRAVVDDDVDADGNEILLYSFTPWRPGAIAGRVYGVGGSDLPVWSNQLAAARPPLGGALARLLYPAALADARAAGANPTGPEAWGWGPPPLLDEGRKVQPAWLHDYLLRPAVIRPAAVLKMPQYSMSAADATKLVEYFAAVSAVDFPYSSPPPGETARSADGDRRRGGRPGDAMKILTDGKTFCAKCHLIGDYSPGGAVGTSLAPNLAEVGRRLRPDYVRRWLANPRSQLPYTPMPVNFPPDGVPLDQQLFPGSSLEQLEAVLDLLLHYDWRIKSWMSSETKPWTDESNNSGTGD